MQKIKVAIIGVSGYAGGELLRLLLRHEGVEISGFVGFSTAGNPLSAAFPYLANEPALQGKRIDPLDADALAEQSDILFMAMPHGQAVAPAMAALAKGKKVIDIGADFRFRDAKIYEEWYKVAHANHALTAQAVYGLPEIYREKIRGAQVVGNPGCYPTASILALYPLVKAGLVELDSLLVDAKSGVSGAGKNPGPGNIFCEADESLKAYNVGKHRHTPEIEQILGEAAGQPVVLNFTPHLVPMSRGILATAYARLQAPSSGAALTALYRETYANEPFVVVHEEGNWPQTKWASGTNLCHIALTYDPRTRRAIITSAIDNLVKGAAGQAIQNMNLLAGFPETQGLQLTPIFP